MPPGLLATTSAVVTQFRALAFDPYSSVNASVNASTATNLSTVGGVTRLAFSTANGPLEVQNASTQITFTLPGVNTTGSADQAVCSYYDTVARAYSTSGCIGVPNPGPPGHVLGFIPGYQTPNDASLAMSWSITGPLTANCLSTFIDCSLPNPPVIFPDPRQPLAIPAIQCPANSAKPPVLRVFYGTQCALWQQGNALNCYWNNTKQAFVGGGCVAIGNVTRCMCRHLTDFAAARAPVLTTCSLSDMLSLDPADIVTKLKFLFIVVIVLFGIMNVGAVAGYVLDTRDRKKMVQQLQLPETDFLELDGGVWTWAFKQAPLDSEVEAPRGSAPTLARLIGIPLIRLRTALPDELCGDWTLGHALGRAGGLSLAFLSSAKEAHKQAVALARKSGSIPAASKPRAIRIPVTQVYAAEASVKSCSEQAAALEAGFGGFGEVMSAQQLAAADVAEPAAAVGSEPAATVALVFSSAGVSTVAGKQDWAALPAPVQTRSGLLQQHDVLSRSPTRRASLSVAFASRRSLLAPISALLIPLTPVPSSTASTQAIMALVHTTSASAEDGVPVIGDGRDGEAVPMAVTTAGDCGLQQGEPEMLAADTVEAHAVTNASERMVGTALVLAFLSVNNVVPVAELTRRKEAALAYFHDVRVRGIDHDFETLMRLFMGMLMEGCLGRRSRWFELARLWRLVLMQRSDGSWGLTRSLATAVEAHAPCSALLKAAESKSFGSGKTGRLLAMGALVMDGGDASADVAGDMVDANLSALNLGDDDVDAAAEAAVPDDDPLAFSRSAMVARMPSSLAALAQQGVPVAQVWGTVLGIVTLEQMSVCWLVSNDEASVEVTAVDAADAYLRTQADEHPELGALLRSGAVHEAARRARAAWARLMEQKMGAVRTSDATKSMRAIEYGQRASARMMQSLMTEHDQFSTFLDESAIVMRWQRWMILVTLICSALLVSIWFYQSRSAQCCAEIRAVLNCESAVYCLGFTGSCSDLTQQFSDLQGPFVYGIPPSEHADLSEYECHAFPDDAYPLDQLLVGLINIAVAIPVAIFLQRCFELANEGEDWPDAWLEMPRGLTKLGWRAVFGAYPTGRWHYARPIESSVDARPCTIEYVQWYVRHSYEMPTATVLRLISWAWTMVQAAVAARRHASKPIHQVSLDGDDPVAETQSMGDEDDAEPAESEGGDSGAVDALAKRLYAALGLLGVYACWAIFSWFIFTYGMLIYRQMGDSAQQKFSQSWGINFAMDSAQQWRDVAQEAAKTAVILVILDMLLILGNRSWFEEHIDHLSVQASLFAGTANGWWQRTVLLVQQQRRVV